MKELVASALVSLTLLTGLQPALAAPATPTNLRLDVLNSINMVKNYNPAPGQRIGVPDPSVLNTHEVPGHTGANWQTNPDPWEPGAVKNGDAYNAVAPPQPSPWNLEVANNYYVDPGASNCTDNQTYGYPQMPRCSMPNNVQAGARIEVASTNGSAGHYNDDWFPDLIGTRSNPIWIVGNKNNPPLITASWRINNASWLYIQNITWGRQTGTNASKSLCLSFEGISVDHIIVRDSTCRNRHYPNKSLNGYGYAYGAGFSIQVQEGGHDSYIQFHHNTFRSLGVPMYEVVAIGSTFHVVNDTQHGFVNGDSVYVEADDANGQVPAPLVDARIPTGGGGGSSSGDATKYTVVNVNSAKTTFQVAVEGTTTPITLKNDGTGTFHVRRTIPSSIKQGDQDTDYHAMTLTDFGKDITVGSTGSVAGYSGDHIWITDNTCTLVNGDCMQVTGQNEGGSTSIDARDGLHLIWFNANKCSRTRQSCFYTKIASHLVISQNYCTSVLNQPGCFNLLYSPTYVWIIGNTAYNVASFSRNATNDMSPTVSSDTKMINYWLNNVVIHTVPTGSFEFNGMPMSGAFFAAQKPPLEAGSRRYIGWNTCIDCYAFFINPGSGDPAGVDYYIYKNAYIDPPALGTTLYPKMQTPAYVYEQNSQLEDSHFNCNLIDSRKPFHVGGTQESNSLAEWQANSQTKEDLQSIYAAPKLTSESEVLVTSANSSKSVLNATPLAGSPLVDPGGTQCAGTKFPDGDDPFQDFNTQYGFNMQVDYYGNPREVNGISDIGAVERQ